jgi:phospholipid/cholesterol/gamma-HCH transport system permease protein
VGLFSLLADLGRFSHFAVQAGLALPRALLQPREVGRQLYQVLIGALPLGAAAGLALGLVVWMHLHQVLRPFGAAEYLPEALALAVVLEFAPTGAGLIGAGRSGASLGAELGSMRLTEQVDALELLGLSPWRVLIAPRVLACMIALPLLTVWMAYAALGGSFLAELIGGSMRWTTYRAALLRDLRVADVWPAVAKTVAFGFLIGVTGCFQGLHADGGTEGVGRAATRGVVWSIFFVLVSNVLLVRAIQVWSG